MISQLSLAIGKEGQNVRLAAKLNWLENRHKEQISSRSSILKPK